LRQIKYALAKGCKLMEAIKIKGTKQGFIFYFNTDSYSWEELYTALEEKLTSGNAIIANSTYLLDEQLQITEEQKASLCSIIEKHGFVPAVTSQANNGNNKFYTSPDSPTAEENDILAPSEGDSLLYNGSVRSGQTLQIQGNVIIMGDVNVGAVVMASGNIIIFGALKGIAHAGVLGDKSAFVLARIMRPLQIRIADSINRSNDDEDESTGYPEIALIKQGCMVIKPYQHTAGQNKFKTIGL